MWTRLARLSTTYGQLITPSYVIVYFYDAHIIDQTTLELADFHLTNLTSGEVIDPSNFEFALVEQHTYGHPELVVHVDFVGLPGDRLPAGNYELSFAAGAVSDIAGNGNVARAFQFTVAPAASAVPSNAPIAVAVMHSDRLIDSVMQMLATRDVGPAEM